MNIIKKQNGSVVINAIGKGYQSLQFSNNARICLTANDVFEVFEGSQKVFSFKFNEVNTTQIEPSAAVGTTTQAALLTTLQENFFFDLGSLASGISSVSGSRIVTSAGGAAVYETLFEITVPNSQIYSIPDLIVKTTNTATGEYFIAWYRIQLRATALGVVSAPGSVFSTQVGETFATDVAIAFDYATANKMKYTISNGTAARTLKWEFFYELHKSNF